MFIRCRRICASRERCKKHRPKYSDNGRDRPLLGTPSSGGRFRLNIEQHPVASNISSLFKQLPRAHSTDASKELDPELPETVEDSLLRHPGAVSVSLHFTANTDGGRRSDSSLWCLQYSPSTRTRRTDVDVFCTHQLVRRSSLKVGRFVLSL